MPSRIKREAPAMESPTSRKRARPAQEAVEDTDEEHIKELHELILQQGILSTLSPAAIKRVANHPNAANIYGQQVHKRVTTYIGKRSERRKRGDPTLSDIINGYMAEISVLAQLSDGLLWACFLSLDLSKMVYTLPTENSYFETEEDTTIFPRSDEFLVSILRKLGPQSLDKPVDAYGPKSLRANLSELKERRGPLDNHPKSKAYYPRTIGLALSWLNSSDFPQKEHDVARQEIIKLNKFAEIELQMAKDVQNKYEQNRDIHEALGMLSEGLAELVPKIRHVSYLDGGLMLAFDLIQFLGRQSFFYCEPGVKGMRRDGLDARADELLEDIAKSIHADNPRFNPKKEAEMLQEQIEYLSELGIESYFPQSFKLFQTYSPEFGKQYALEIFEMIKKRIEESKAAVGRRYAQCTYDSKVPIADWLSKSMVEIIPDIKALGKKQHGECLAGELLLYLGEHSFVPMFDRDGNPCNYGKRDSDAPADEALVELITAVNDSENIYHEIPWETKKADWLQTILSGKMQLSKMGVDGYFEKSERLLSA